MTDIGRSGAMGRPVEADKPPGLLYNIFVRNITAKIAASPMVAIVLIVFIGCTLWSVWFSFTDSRSLPNGDFVGFTRLGSNALQSLRENIPRYQYLRERVEPASRFTN